MDLIGAVTFEILPDLLNRIEFWSISWKPLNAQSLVSTSEFSNDWALVDAAIVPDQNDIATQVTEEPTQKARNTGSIEVVFLKTDV